MATTKFSSKMDVAALKELRAYAREIKRPISDILSEAVKNHLGTVRVRTAFRSATEVVMQENAELLRRLAK